MRHDTSGILQGNATNYGFIITTVIKICANDNAARATRNNSAAVNLKYGMHFIASEFTFRKEPFHMQLGCNHTIFVIFFTFYRFLDISYFVNTLRTYFVFDLIFNSKLKTIHIFFSDLKKYF